MSLPAVRKASGRVACWWDMTRLVGHDSAGGRRVGMWIHRDERGPADGLGCPDRSFAMEAAACSFGPRSHSWRLPATQAVWHLTGPTAVVTGRLSSDVRMCLAKPECFT